MTDVNTHQYNGQTDKHTHVCRGVLRAQMVTWLHHQSALLSEKEEGQQQRCIIHGCVYPMVESILISVWATNTHRVIHNVRSLEVVSMVHCVDRHCIDHKRD